MEPRFSAATEVMVETVVPMETADKVAQAEVSPHRRKVRWSPGTVAPVEMAE